MMGTTIINFTININWQIYFIQDTLSYVEIQE